MLRLGNFSGYARYGVVMRHCTLGVLADSHFCATKILKIIKVALICGILFLFTGCGSLDRYNRYRDRWYGDFGYCLAGLLTDYRGSSKEIIIPSVIKGYKLWGISSRAFEKKGLTNVIIPDSIRFIGSSAFADNQLTSIIIPKSVTQIQENAFVKNPLTNITLDPDNTDFTVKDFFLLSKGAGFSYTNNEKRLLLYYGSKNNITIPESVTEIDDGAFSNNQLTSITLLKGFLVPHNTVFGEPLYDIKLGDRESILLDNGTYELKNNQWYCNGKALQQPAKIVPGTGIYISSIDGIFLGGDISLSPNRHPIYLSPGFHKIEVGYSHRSTRSEGTVTFAYAFVLDSYTYD